MASKNIEVLKNHPNDIFSDDILLNSTSTHDFIINNIEKTCNYDKPEYSPCCIINEEINNVPELVLHNSPKKKKKKKKKN